MTAMHLATSIHSVGRYLMAQGALPAELLRDKHLPPDLMFDSRARMPRDDVLDLGETLKERMSDPLAFLHVLQRFSLSEYGDWMDQLAGQSNLHQALRHLCMKISFLETGTRLSLHIDKNDCRLRAELIGRLAHRPDSYIEGLLFNLLRLVRFAGDAFPVQVCLPHVAHHVTAMGEIYGSPVSFSCDVAELVFPRETLVLPVARPHPGFAQVLEPTEFTCREVNRLIRSTLDFDRPTAKQVASDLSVNLRSMQRHLAAWGLTFEEMLDVYRKRRAMQYLSGGTLTITDIAQHLGYSDAAHFTRAFRRWYGVPPITFRGEYSLQH